VVEEVEEVEEVMGAWVTQGETVVKEDPGP